MINEQITVKLKILLQNKTALSVPVFFLYKIIVNFRNFWVFSLFREADLLQGVNKQRHCHCIQCCTAEQMSNPEHHYIN